MNSDFEPTESTKRIEEDRTIWQRKVVVTYDVQPHREDGPAIEWNDGTKEWYINGKLHRDGGPAIERSDGSEEWYQHGKLHREDGPAVTEPDGSTSWWLNDLPIREEGGEEGEEENTLLQRFKRLFK